ncbi:SpoIIE family protein phosphatase [Actinacidiphila glaucinigra]|uniref:SpoIIE family protein phosphatase n=1 Tax=Actinacidiphila glaucinigra TaxID=235986 RepID=UPI002DD83116|nr:SpoIIE family protein phosphatase [Actinacidiphila glaucinigra]WSD63933.1 SpoIIE family protein phosphatase [Actinacidiphila glaucinigra]
MTTAEAVSPADRVDAGTTAEWALMVFDQQGTVVAWTSAAERHVGYSAGEVVGRSAALVLPFPEDAPTMAAFIDRCRAHGGWSGPMAVRHRDGRVCDVSLRISMLRGQGTPARWLVSMATVNGTVAESRLNHALFGISVRDPQLRCTWVNDAMGRHDAVPRDRRLGRRLTETWPHAQAETFEQEMLQVLGHGGASVREYRTWLTTGPRRGHLFAMTLQCLQGADGQALGVCVISMDATESRQAHERMAVLGRAGSRFGSTLDAMHTSQELADLATSLFADYTAVDMEQSVLCGEPAFRIGQHSRRSPVLLRGGLASIRKGAPESPWARGEKIVLPQPSRLTDHVLNVGRSYMEPILDTAPTTWAGQDPARAPKIRQNGVHSLMIVPIRIRHTLLGVAVFLRTDNPVPFQDVDLILAEELAARAALALDRARRHVRSAALMLRRDVPPQHASAGTALEVASRYLPADREHGVGGDWFDVIPQAAGRVALVVGDVVGHGPDAAATMGVLRTTARMLADMDLPPEDVLAHLDDTVQGLAGGNDTSNHGLMVFGATCLYAVYDPATRRCTVALAGHPPPVLTDPQGRVTFPDLPTGTPLGMGLGGLFRSAELELPQGSVLGLYTDGLVEARDHDIEEGMNRLGGAMTEPGLPLEDLCARALETVPGRTASDDVTLLLVRTRLPGAAP